jgi:hypothetical protein
VILHIQELSDSYYTHTDSQINVKELLKTTSACPEPIKYKSVIKTKVSQDYWRRKQTN